MSGGINAPDRSAHRRNTFSVTKFHTHTLLRAELHTPGLCDGSGDFEPTAINDPAVAQI